MEIFTWLGMGVCIIHSAIFSGLNLALFGVTRLRLEIEVSSGNPAAAAVLDLRKDSNFLLTIILWGNVAFNTLLAILSNSILAGVYAFMFSTFIITFIGEIMPQAYFSRNALKMAALLSPVLKFYRVVLYPVAKPSSMILDWWLGKEGIQYFRERQIREMIKKHIEADEADVDRMEGLGALNFLAFDDLAISQEGEPVNPESIITLPITNRRPVFPDITPAPADPFLQTIQKSGEKWVIIADREAEPIMVLDADGFLRSALFLPENFNPYIYCHRPIVVKDAGILLGDVVHHLKVEAEGTEDDVIDQDIILLWAEEKRIITGADILGRLMRGIVDRSD
ncbi:MAG: DUF21 domain-containing protein [candidate division Zixibacteria bacterium]|nr:DUF21 domain-containing protein [candidate division Zixibacteria bacterium]